MPKAPKIAPSRTVATLPEATTTPTARLIGWGIYAGLTLVAFCFGVWAGNQRPKVIETVRALPSEPLVNKLSDTSNSPAPQQAITSAASSKKDLSTEPKKQTEPGVIAKAEPKPKPEPTKPPEPKKTPEPKKAPDLKPAPSSPSATFVKDVLPIFRSKCTSCHGDSKGVKGGLDLRTVDAIIKKGGDGGPGVKPGNLKDSSVWVSIDDGAMPPAGSGKDQLTDAEKQIVRNWIMSGAK